MAAYTWSFPFGSDSRGNRLDAWTTVAHEAGHYLWLQGPHEVVVQLTTLAPDYTPMSLPDSARPTWTHVLTAPGRLRTNVAEFLDLLKIVVSLPSPVNINVALALDWYKQPVDGVDPYHWPNTELGDLVHRGKYLYRADADRQAEVGRDLVGRVCGVIDKHFLLRRAEIVLNVPGHDSKRVSFGSRMAATVAKNFNLPLARVRARDQFRPEAKDLHPSQRAELLSGQFYVETSLEGKKALIVDDVFRSGESMNEGARAALEAGAVRVYGICAVRTMRK